MKGELLKYRARTERRLARVKKRVEEYKQNESNLSNHGYWSLGYWVGVETTLENQLDDIDDMLNNI